jgi:hypothetical protein
VVYIYQRQIYQPSVPVDSEDNVHVSLAESRPRRLNRRLPKRYETDALPQPLPQLPPVPPPTPSPAAVSESTIGSLRSCISRALTPRNVFGLFRQYHSEVLPSHDPEEHVELQDLSDIPTITAHPQIQPSSPSLLYPYPNESSFLLGDWYWNRGHQKSHQSFSELVSIVGHLGFKPEDVRHTKWSEINSKLAKNDFDEQGGAKGEEEWLDEDAGWKKSPISISVPFHSRAKMPGPKNFVVGDLYHRSLIAVIREKLADPQADPHFHYEPFELFWKPDDTRAKVQVHGELYTSPAFLDAHREVQELPAEPGCNLPRVVAAMMFWSDATHLTSFGNAKLWPCYLCFGNESKYRRCKPTCHLCSHVAYFQTVHLLPS